MIRRSIGNGLYGTGKATTSFQVQGSGESGSLKLRAYFDQYPTETLIMDNESYSR